MNFSMIVWLSIVTFIVVLATVKCIHATMTRLHVSQKPSHGANENGRRVKLFEMGSEREEIWIPGDIPMLRQFDDEVID